MKTSQIDIYNKSINQFFELLQAGLWGREVDQTLFLGSSVNWDLLYNFAHRQSVSSIIYDAVMTLPQDLRPDKALLLKWGFFTIKTEETNKYHNDIISRLFSLLNSRRIYSILLKGEGLAYYYLQPLHRQHGDIDVFIEKDRLPEVIDILNEIGSFQIKNKTSKDITFEICGLSLEVHFNSIVMLYPPNRRIWEKFQKEFLINSKCYISINNYQIRIPSENFNILYVFLHSLSHLLSSELNFKQLSDWTMILYKCADKYDKELLISMINKMHLNRVFNSFLYMAINYMGLPTEFWQLSEKASHDGNKIIESIFSNNQEVIQSKNNRNGYIFPRLKTLNRSIKNKLNFFVLSPLEIVCYPFWLISRLPYHIFYYFNNSK